MSAEGGVEVHIEHPMIESMMRTIRKEGDKIITHNDIFKLKEEFQDHPGKIGLRAFARQVEQSQAAGISHIETYAARSPGETYIDKNGVVKEKWAGYYVWPSYGYDGPLRSYTVNALQASGLPAKLKAATRIRQVMAEDAGREWWKEHGNSIDVRFDLMPGSYSMKNLDTYLQKKLGDVK